MLYLSAQPDDFYFTWQLELQLFNFKKLGILPCNIHVLIAYDTRCGLQEHFRTLIEKNKDSACFFIYPDNRGSRSYPSSVRPHIIRQHFLKYPALEEEAIFYHDSDVVLRTLPDFENLLKEDDWYVSDTRTYLDSSYIKRTAGEQVLQKMCEIVHIDINTVLANDNNCGGAQYLLKKVPAAFWEKVEKDCEEMYPMLCDDNCVQAEDYLKEGKKLSQYKGIQAWCTDMWCVFWNALLFKKTVRISTELDFCWSTSPVEDWHNKKILHYSGAVTKGDTAHFRKSDYINYSPLYENDLVKIEKGSCSYSLLELIQDFREEQHRHRIDLSDVSVLIPLRIDSQSRLDNLVIVCRFIDKYFDTRIIICESDTDPKVNCDALPACCRYVFRQDDNPMLHRTRINNYLIQLAETSIVALYDVDVIFPVDQLLNAVQLIRKDKAAFVTPYDGTCLGADGLFKIMFGKILDTGLFTDNLNKLNKGAERAWGGCVLLHREIYIRAGMENEYIESWGPEDVERVKRIKNLKYQVRRVAGPLFHLPHERKENSSYLDTEQRIKYMEEYFKVSNLGKPALEAYIATWPWIQNTDQ